MGITFLFAIAFACLGFAVAQQVLYLPPVYAPVLNPITVTYQLIPNAPSLPSTCSATVSPPSCPAPPDVANLSSICGCTSLAAVNLTSYSFLTNCNYYSGLQAVSGALTVYSDSAITSLTGLEVRWLCQTLCFVAIHAEGCLLSLPLWVPNI